MTPLLPRAPIRDPCAAAASTAAADVAEVAAWASSTEERSVRYMFEPVSPSGTGNTLRSLISSWLAWSHARALRSAASTSSPPTSRSGSRRRVSLDPASARAIVGLQMDSLDVDVHGQDRDAQWFLHRVAHPAHQVVRHLADARAVSGDDVKLDEDAALADLDLHAPVGVLAIEALGDPVAQPARGHADDAVALLGGVADDGRDDTRRHLDPAEALGAGEGVRGFDLARHVGSHKPRGGPVLSSAASRVVVRVLAKATCVAGRNSSTRHHRRPRWAVFREDPPPCLSAAMSAERAR